MEEASGKMEKGIESPENEENESDDLDLSIIIPIFNGGGFIKQCLDSVANQTLGKNRYEVIVVDDGSTDNTPTILEEFRNKFEISVIRLEKNQGVANARIVGCSEARGQYIGWIDADDFIEPDMYALMLEKAEREDLDLVICDYMFESDKPVKRKKWFHEWKGVMDWEFLENNVQHWNKIMKKEIMDRYDFCAMEEKFGEGALGQIIPFTDKIGTISKKFYHYRLTAGSASSNRTNLEHYEKDVEIASVKLDFVKERKMSKEWIEYFNNARLYQALLAMLIAANVKNKEAYNKYRKMVKEERLFKKKNKKFLSKKFSKFHLFVIRWVAMANYPFARLCCKVGL